MPRLKQDTAPQAGALHTAAFLRVRQLVKGQAPILPFSDATLWRKVKAGEFPAPVKISTKVTAWRASDVRAWVDRQGAE
jgi:predicted DNA-binding transcriptional regulator AlpA